MTSDCTCFPAQENSPRLHQQQPSAEADGETSDENTRGRGADGIVCG